MPTHRPLQSFSQTSAVRRSGCENFFEHIDRLLQKALLRAQTRHNQIISLKQALEKVAPSDQVKTKDAVIAALFDWLNAPEKNQESHTLILLGAILALVDPRGTSQSQTNTLLAFALSQNPLPAVNDVGARLFFLRASILLGALSVILGTNLESLRRSYSARSMLLTRLCVWALFNSQAPTDMLVSVCDRCCPHAAQSREGNTLSERVDRPHFQLYLRENKLRTSLFDSAQTVICELLKIKNTLLFDWFSQLTSVSSGRIFSLLDSGGLVSMPMIALRWHGDGQSRNERLWALTDTVCKQLLLKYSPSKKQCLEHAAYDFLHLQLDASIATHVASRSLESVQPTGSDILLNVMQGVIATSGLSSWSQGVLAEALSNIDAAVAGNPSLASFYGVNLTNEHRQAIAYAEKGAEKSNLSTQAKILERLRQLNMRYAAAQALTRTNSARAATPQMPPHDSSRLPEVIAPTGLFVPKDAFSVPSRLWLGPLEALGLAAVSDAQGNLLKRFRAGARHPVEGIVFAFFRSPSAALPWLGECLSPIDENRPLNRQTQLARFLRLDAMVRTLTALAAETDCSQKCRDARLLNNSVPLGDTAISGTQGNALRTFLSATDLRAVRSASLGEMVHGFVAHRHYLKEGFASASGLESVLTVHKQHQIARSSRRIRRLRSALAINADIPNAHHFKSHS